MIKKQKVHVKVGDQVKIISGFHKNETGEVIKINPKTGKIIVQGINFKFKHVKPTTEKKNEWKKTLRNTNRIELVKITKKLDIPEDMNREILSFTYWKISH